jgi:aspartokinase/homoserine dehydrogenase 1
MSRTVIKFGGSILRNADDFLSLAAIARRYQSPVIIVSALSGVTDAIAKVLESVLQDNKSIEILLDDLRSRHQAVIEQIVREPQELLDQFSLMLGEVEKLLQGVCLLNAIPDFARDQILSYGEKFSSLLVTASLMDRGIDAVELRPEKIGLLTDGHFGDASVDFGKAETAVSAAISGQGTVVIPGFYGINDEGRVTLFGRGGSDYSAASIARCIKASSLDLWKDVKGYRSADPKLVRESRLVDKLSYMEAAELSYFGASIFHPRTIEPLRQLSIPIRVFNFDEWQERDEPYSVVSETAVVSERVIKSITTIENIDIVRITLANAGAKPGILAKVTTKLQEQKINIKSVITSQTTINILIASDNLLLAHDLIQDALNGDGNSVSILSEVALVAAVGEGLMERQGVLIKILGAVSKARINMLLVSAGASNTATYFIVAKEDVQRAVIAVHNEVFHEIS